MPLPLPNLDDRRWVDLVDEGRALIPRHAPEWTDHNVHDPGITFMELLAWLSEMTIYQLNRVPSRHLRKFLALIGFFPLMPRAAQTFLSFTPDPGTNTFEIPAGQWLGQPERTNGDTKPFMGYDMFSIPSNTVTQRRGQQVDAYPEIIISSAESYFLQAEAALRGIGSGDPQALMASGIREAMKLWGVGGDADSYLASAPLADISGGTMDEKLEKLAIQRWIASYTDGFEAWAIVRKTGYPSNLASGVSDAVIYALGTLNGDYPQRMRYGGNAQSNPNYDQAISAQGPDVQATKLWFAK